MNEKVRRLTVDLPPILKHRLKIYCVTEGIEIKQFIIGLLETELNKLGVYADDPPEERDAEKDVTSKHYTPLDSIKDDNVLPS